MNKYLIVRKKGEMASELFHLKKDVALNKNFTIPWIIRKVKKIKTKEDVIKYHLQKIQKIANSKYFVVEPTTKNSVNDLVNICQKEISEGNGDYTVMDICQLAQITYNKIAVPIWFSVFAMKINLFEFMLISILVAVLANVI